MTPEAAVQAQVRSVPLAVEPDCYVLGGDYCIWQGINGTGNEEVNTTSDPLLPYRNEDESVENSGAPYDLYLRLYYSPNYAGAWVCINPGSWLPNASNYNFNNGSGDAGYGATVWKNVASARFNTEACTNPIGREN
jgi:Peptidase inhibitor family I36